MAFNATRIKKLNQKLPKKGEYVLYWMQQAQRAEDNHALEYAIEEANFAGIPLVVAFCLMPDYPDANTRHYTFMLEGLQQTQQTLKDRGILMILKIGDPVTEVLQLSRKASVIVCDTGYLRHQKSWRNLLASNAGCSVVQVETEVIIPVEQVSHKPEYAAYTIRPKISRLLDQYLKPVHHESVRNASNDLAFKGETLNDIPLLLKKLHINDGLTTVSDFFTGGTKEAKARFELFLQKKILNYVKNRNKPATSDISQMSPYLHFGQVSALYLALKVKKYEKKYPEAVACYLEELIIRRELAINFVHFNPNYDSLDCLPAWASKTLEEHSKDPREHDYSLEQLTACQTHDPYWNAAMKEMIATGYMHNYMRMYWGKKIFEWSSTPVQAYKKIIFLNNQYFLDGRDPNSYAGAAWIFGMHDRAWFERPVFGKVRYMAASGLERKCDIKQYVFKTDQLLVS